MTAPGPTYRIAIACGGTGGHLYPGLAVAERLFERGAEVTLLVSTKAVDRRAVQEETRFRIVALPARGFSPLHAVGFALGFWSALRQARREIREHCPRALLAMGGFTSVTPAMAARSAGIPVLVHEANAIPGRANRWLARRAQGGFVYFPEAIPRMAGCPVRRLGMPVREQFQRIDAGASRMAMGLAPGRPTLLVMGGSQGARAINNLTVESVPNLAKSVEGLQVLHLTGDADEGRVREAYRLAGVPAVVRAFVTEMEFALGAADATLARAGASTLAEVAAMRVPAVLIPYPHAADDHQLANARAFEKSGAAVVLPESEATAESVTAALSRIFLDAAVGEALRAKLAAWHDPGADVVLAEELLLAAGNTKAPDPRPLACSEPERRPRAA